MHPDPVLHQFFPDHFVLELPERATAPGPALELHVILDPDGSVAWRLTDRGGWLGCALVGQA